MKMKLSIILLALLPVSLLAQKKTYDLAALFTANKVMVVNRNVSVVKDGNRSAVKLDEKSGEGLVWVNGLSFTQGTLEFDVRGKDVLQKSFVGIAFHGTDDTHFDAIYFRPFNFHSKDSVRKIHAVQYISHPEYTWSRLREEHNGKYEKALVNPPDPNGWFHVRIEVKGKQVSVYVNDDKNPSLTVTKISTTTTGKVGVWTGEGSGGEFANLVVTTR